MRRFTALIAGLTIAIGLSEARRKGQKVPARKKAGKKK